MKAQRTGTIHHVLDSRTAAVTLDRQLRHPKYGKSYRRTTNLLVDTPADLTVVPGAVVTIEATRPLSKRKAWRVTAVLSTPTVADIVLVNEPALADVDAAPEESR